jgi:hypothetical protein
MNDECYNIESDIIDRMFPEAKFIIAIALNNFDDVLSTGKEKLIIKCIHNCYCYDKTKRQPEYFIVNGTECNNIITVKDCIQSLVDNNYESSCNHIFLEFFEFNTQYQLEPFFGS